MSRSPAVPHLTGAIPTALTRAVVEVAAEVIGHPLTSSLVSHHPWAPGEEPHGRERGTLHASRFEFGGPRGSVLVLERAEYRGQALVAGPSGSRWLTAFAFRGFGDPLDRSGRELVAKVVAPPGAPSGPAPASNLDVAELTRRVYALSPDTLAELTDSLTDDPAPSTALPILSDGPGGLLLVGGEGGELTRALLVALREVDSGVPLGWALRRVPGARS